MVMKGRVEFTEDIMVMCGRIECGGCGEKRGSGIN